MVSSSMASTALPRFEEQMVDDLKNIRHLMFLADYVERYVLYINFNIREDGQLTCQQDRFVAERHYWRLPIIVF
jgi:hypothetical protein